MFSKLLWLSALLVLGSFAAPVANNSNATREESIETRVSTCFSDNADSALAPVQANKAAVVKRGDPDGRVPNIDLSMYLITAPDVARNLQKLWPRSNKRGFFDYLENACFADFDLGNRLYLGQNLEDAKKILLNLHPEFVDQPPKDYKLFKFQVKLSTKDAKDLGTIMYIYERKHSKEWQKFIYGIAYPAEAPTTDAFRNVNKAIIAGPIGNNENKVWAFSFKPDAARRYLNIMRESLPSAPSAVSHQEQYKFGQNELGLDVALEY